MPVQLNKMEIISLFCALSCECLIGPKIDFSFFKQNVILFLSWFCGEIWPRDILDRFHKTQPLESIWGFVKDIV